MDDALLRQRLHAAVDQIIDELTTARTDTDQRTVRATADDVERLRSLPDFEFVWPAQDGVERFHNVTEYRHGSFGDRASVIVGWTTRPAWSRDDRRRAVVFGRCKPEDGPGKWYPWTEFVEADTDGYAAPVPNPKRPRALLADGDPLPPRFAGKKVARSDEVFKSIREGVSLRLVVDENDEEEMVRHGYWVAGLRGRI